MSSFVEVYKDGESCGGCVWNRSVTFSGSTRYQSSAILVYGKGNRSDPCLFKQVTQREVFYSLRSYFSSQREVDDILLDVGCLLDCERSDMLISTASSGALAGSLSLSDDNGSSWIDCEKLEARPTKHRSFHPPCPFDNHSLSQSSRPLSLHVGRLAHPRKHRTSIHPSRIFPCEVYPRSPPPPSNLSLSLFLWLFLKLLLLPIRDFRT